MWNDSTAHLTQPDSGLAEPSDSNDSASHLEALIAAHVKSVQRDYSRFGFIIGATLLAAGAIMGAFDLPASVSTTSLVWGAVITTVTLWLRHKRQAHMVAQLNVLADIHEAALQADVRKSVIGELLVKGLPNGVTPNDVTVLLNAPLSQRRGASVR